MSQQVLNTETKDAIEAFAFDNFRTWGLLSFKGSGEALYWAVRPYFVKPEKVGGPNPWKYDMCTFLGRARDHRFTPNDVSLWRNDSDGLYRLVYTADPSEGDGPIAAKVIANKIGRVCQFCGIQEDQSSTELQHFENGGGLIHSICRAPYWAWKRLAEDYKLSDAYKLSDEYKRLQANKLAANTPKGIAA